MTQDEICHVKDRIALITLLLQSEQLSYKLMEEIQKYKDKYVAQESHTIKLMDEIKQLRSTLNQVENSVDISYCDHAVKHYDTL